MTQFTIAIPDLYNNNDLTIKSHKHQELIRYSKNSQYNKLFRSLIVKSGKLVSFAPPKSIKLSELMREGNVNAEEFIDGTMINLYFDGTEWEIATRSEIGGTNYFYNKNKNFKWLFLDSLASNFDFDKLPKTGSNGLYRVYSFVIQHKENRIVTRIEKNQIYLVDCYEIDNDNNGNAFISCVDIDNALQVLLDDFSVKRPKVYKIKCNLSDINELQEYYSSDKTPYCIMGVIFKNTQTGYRSKLTNPNYRYVRKLRGNQPNFFYYYLELRKTNQIKEFLKYYPEYKSNVLFYSEVFRNYCNKLYKYYVECYILRKNPLGKFEYQYKNHMFKLHELYKTNKEKTTYNKVKRYFSNLHPKQQLYVLKFNIDDYN